MTSYLTSIIKLSLPMLGQLGLALAVHVTLARSVMTGYKVMFCNLNQEIKDVYILIYKF